jgi:threonine 3-dehydrogenase
VSGSIGSPFDDVVRFDEAVELRQTQRAAIPLERGEAARLALPTGFKSEEAQSLSYRNPRGNITYPVRVAMGERLRSPPYFLMKAIVKSKREPGLWLEDIPEPTVGINDVLIRVRRAGICGTDVHIYNWDEWAQRTIPVPMAIGHEFVGEIVEVGSEVTDFQPGELVSGEGHVVCGHCRNCLAGRRHLCANIKGVGVNRPGGFADYIAMPMTNVWRHKPNVDLDVAAIFDPFGNAVHTALSFPVLGEDVLITGAGPIGIMAAAVVRYAAARHIVITDKNPYRLALARKMGVTCAVDTAKTPLAQLQKELGMTEGFDVGLEMSGVPSAMREMIANMSHGAKIAMLGIPTQEFAIDWTTVVFNMLTIKGIYGREMYETWYKMGVMLENGLDIRPVITHRFPYQEFEQAFQVMKSGNAGKVILEWS